MACSFVRCKDTFSSYGKPRFRSEISALPEKTAVGAFPDANGERPDRRRPSPRLSDHLVDRSFQSGDIVLVREYIFLVVELVFEYLDGHFGGRIVDARS